MITSLVSLGQTVIQVAGHTVIFHVVVISSGEIFIFPSIQKKR